MACRSDSPDDDDWEAKVELLAQVRVAVVSFTFGCPSAEVVRSLKSAGSEVWATATTPAEARVAAQAGADVLVLQGVEAGGHRATFVDTDRLVPLLGSGSRACSVRWAAVPGTGRGVGCPADLFSLLAGASAISQSPPEECD